MRWLVPRESGPAEPPDAILEGLEIEPDSGEALRYLGYPVQAVPEPRVTARLEQALASLRGRLNPRGIYRLHPVTSATSDRLELGETVFTGRVGEFLGHAQQAAAFVATAGPEIVEMATQAMRDRDTLGGLVYHAVGSALAEAMAQRIAAHLASRLQPGQALTLPYSPGYCGIPLAEQRTLFRLVDAGRIGVELLPTLIMRPVKSVSGLIGIGPAGRVRAYGSPCDRCPLTDCRMRR